MRYITSIEQMGIEEGREEERRSMLLRFLGRKLGTLPGLAIAEIDRLSMEQLEDLTEAWFDLETIEDLMQWLQRDR